MCPPASRSDEENPWLRMYRQRRAARGLGLESNELLLLDELIDEADATGFLRLSDQVLAARTALSLSTLGRTRLRLTARRTVDNEPIVTVLKKGHCVTTTAGRHAESTRYQLGAPLLRAVATGQLDVLR